MLKANCKLKLNVNITKDDDFNLNFYYNNFITNKY